MYQNSALRVMDAPYEQLTPTPKKKASHLKVLSNQNAKNSEGTQAAASPSQTLAKARIAIRQQAALIRAIGTVFLIFGIVTEAAIGILCGNAVGTWGIWISSAFLLLGIMSAFVCIGMTYLLFSSSEVLTDLVRKLKKEV